jgi:Tol biopolymer transport system component/DNA-binding winged helix-turn-helix (wHTH) protein
VVASAWRDGFALGEARVRPNLLEIERDGRCERIEPRMMDVLVALAASAPAPLTRDELMAQVWAGRIVTEDSLNRIVSRLRAAFDDDPRQPRVIETIPRRGYRLLLAPEPLQAAQPHGPASAEAATGAAASPGERGVEPRHDTEAARSATRPRRGVIATAALGAAALVAILVARREAPMPTPRAAGTAPRVSALTAYPGRESFVSFAPDGEQIVFVWDGDEPGNRDLYRRAVAGGVPERLTRDPGGERASAFAPDGRSLAFVRIAQAQCEILLMTLATREERVLATCNAAAQPRIAFAPEGDRIVFNDNPGMQGQRLVELRLDNLTRRDLTTPAAGQHDYFPAISHDGRWLAFGRVANQGVQEVHRMPARGGTPEPLTSQRAVLSHLAWTPDGGIVYVSDAGGENGLWQVRPGDAPRWLGLSGGGAQFPALSRDGRRLAFERVQLESRLVFVTADAPGQVAREVLASTRQDWYPDCTADAGRVVFASNRSGQFGLWSVDARQAEPRALREGLGLGPASGSLSPDGREVIYAELQDGDAQICSVSLADGGHRCLITDPGRDVQPSFRPEGDGFVFASERDGHYRLYRADRDGRRVRKLSDTAAVAPRALRGDRILFMRPGEPGLWLREADGGERRLHGDLPALAYRNFDGDGDQVWLVDSRGRLLQLDLTAPARAPRDLGELPGIDPRSGLRWCAQAQRFVYARLERNEIDLELVEGLF